MLILSDDVREMLRSLDSDTRRLIGGEIRKYQDGMQVNIKKLRGKENMWRLTAGSWRIIIETRQDEAEKIFEITDVIQRKEAYRR